MPWTGQRLRDARARRGWTQDDLVRELGASKRSIVAWEAEEAQPQPKWRQRLNDLFGENPDTDVADGGMQHQELDLSNVDDLHLLAEVARRMAQRNRHPGHLTPLPKLRWARGSAPSASRADEHSSGPDNGDEKGVTSSGP